MLHSDAAAPSTYGTIFLLYKFHTFLLLLETLRVLFCVYKF